MDRRERIEDLHEQSNKLADSAQTFRRSANRVRKQMWWKVSSIHDIPCIISV